MGAEIGEVFAVFLRERDPALFRDVGDQREPGRRVAATAQVLDHARVDVGRADRQEIAEPRESPSASGASITAQG